VVVAELDEIGTNVTVLEYYEDVVRTCLLLLYGFDGLHLLRIGEMSLLSSNFLIWRVFLFSLF